MYSYMSAITTTAFSESITRFMIIGLFMKNPGILIYLAILHDVVIVVDNGYVRVL